MIARVREARATARRAEFSVCEGSNSEPERGQSWVSLPSPPRFITRTYIEFTPHSSPR